MIGDFILAFSEFVFYLTGGIPLLIAINPGLVILGVVAVCIIAAIPMMWALVKPTFLNVVASFFISLPLIVILTGTPAIQLDIMTECRTFEAPVESHFSGPTMLEFRECRTKGNYYDEAFGPWEIVGEKQ